METQFIGMPISELVGDLEKSGERSVLLNAIFLLILDKQLFLEC